MNPVERHRRLRALLLGARAQAPEARARWLEEACASNAELLREAQQLLEHDQRTPPEVDALFRPGRSDALRARLALALEEGTAPDVHPERIGPFRIRGRIGAGGMGIVYEAEQESPRRTVALKVLQAELRSPEMVRRFEHEGEMLGRLSHPGIAQVFSSGRSETEIGQRPWIAMELVRGRALTDFAQERALTARACVELILQVTEAVVHAHGHAVIHRDLKPGNVLVDDSGRARVLDFGVARAVEADPRSASCRTEQGQILGTLAYMSPEQAAGDPRRIDGRTDVYSLGAMLYELLGGRRPHKVSEVPLPEAVRRIREEEPPRLGRLRPALGRDLDTIVHRALAKEPDRRYPTAAAFAQDLRRFLADEPITARPPSELYVLRKFLRRNRRGVAVIGATTVAVALGLLAARFAREKLAMHREAREELYRSSLVLASRAADQLNFPAAEERLEGAPPELRGWGWHHLHGRVNALLREGRVPGVRVAAFLDESDVVAVDGLGTVRTWNLVTDEWKEVGRTGRLPLVLSPDGKHLLSFGAGELRLGDPLGGPGTEAVFARPGFEPRARDGNAALSTGGERAVVCSEEGELLLLDAAGGSVVTLARGLKPRATAFAPDGRALAVGLDRGFELWDVEQRERRWRVAESTWVHALGFYPSGATLLVGTFEGIRVLDTASGSEVERWMPARLEPHRNERFSAIVVDPTGARFLVANRRGQLGLLDARTGAELYGMKQPERATWSSSETGLRGDEDQYLAFGPDGATFLSICGPEDTLRVWATRQNGVVLRGHESYVYGVAFDSAAGLVASGSWDRTVRLWDLSTGEELAALATPTHVTGLALSGDGRTLAAGHETGLRIWGAETARLLVDLPLGPLRCLAFNPDGTRLAVGSAKKDRGISELEVGSWRELGKHLLSTPTSALAYSPDGALLAVGKRDAGLLLLDAHSGTTLAEVTGKSSADLRFGGVLSVAFAPGGKCLAAAHGNSEVVIHAVPSLEELVVLHGHEGEVFAVAFSPDGARIATGGRYGQLRLWNTKGQPLLVLTGHEDYIYALAFDAEGRYIATGSGDATVRIWDSATPHAAWLERLEVQALRPRGQERVASWLADLDDPSLVLERIESEEGHTPAFERLARQELVRSTAAQRDSGTEH